MDVDLYDCLPWEIKPYSIIKNYSNNPRSFYRGDPPRGTFTAKFQIARNCTTYKQGDIIQFHSAYYPRLSWQEWFVVEEDKKEMYKRNKQIPGYAGKEYAIILARYKWVKYKRCAIYQDYGTIVMMLTGPRTGHVRKFYIKSPWNIVSRFPYIKKHLPKKVADIVWEPFREQYVVEMLTDKGRNKYLEILYRKFNPEEHIHE